MEFFHRGKSLDSAPRLIVEKVNGTDQIRHEGVAKEEFQFFRLDLFVRQEDLKDHLRGEDQFVLFEERSRGVQRRGIGDRIDQIQHTLFDIVALFGFADGLGKDDFEG